MKFFVPCKDNNETDEEAYARLRESVYLNWKNWKITSERIFGLHYVHNGKRYYIEVGKPDPEAVREVVTAIFSTTTGADNMFLICTRRRGGGTRESMADSKGMPPTFFE